MRASAVRSRIPFRAVNVRGEPGHDPALQRHHLLPRQLLSRRCFGTLFDQIGSDAVGFNDFRANGLLLPAREEAAIRMGMPLHRGPHSHYNEMVIERVGTIERGWSASRPIKHEAALGEALMRLSLLQRALRRRLLSSAGNRFALNRRDPLAVSLDFTDLDAMADALWGETQNI